jgi:hypothetical protein
MIYNDEDDEHEDNGRTSMRTGMKGLKQRAGGMNLAETCWPLYLAPALSASICQHGELLLYPHLYVLSHFSYFSSFMSVPCF